MRPGTNAFFEVPREGTSPITKRDAAIRQLETAITLWVDGRDPVSVCTLASAGHSLIRDLNRTFKAKSFFDARIFRGFHQLKELVPILTHSQPNFFKHAGRDPDEIIYFHPGIHLMLILNGIFIYNQWGFDERPLFVAFWCWVHVAIKNSTEAPNFQNLLKTMFADHISSAGKRRVFDAVLKVATEQFAGKKATPLNDAGLF